MQEILFSAVIDAVVALKQASKGLPNTLLRDINAIHSNTTFGDLPRELQAGISAAVRAAFTRLLKEGYSVAPAEQGRQRPPSDNRGPRRDGGSGRPPGKPRHGGPGKPSGRGGGRNPGSRPPRGS